MVEVSATGEAIGLGDPGTVGATTTAAIAGEAGSAETAGTTVTGTNEEPPIKKSRCLSTVVFKFKDFSTHRIQDHYNSCHDTKWAEFTSEIY